ncbi:glutamate 5-kinase, partial [Lecanoromycetidae sp. Uapishka_2]
MKGHRHLTIVIKLEKFGDNDTLSAITAAMVHADYLFLMTDVDCLYDKNPRTHPDAQPIDVVEDVASLEADVSSAGSTLGTGGMSTKIVAARLATSAGVTTIITRSSSPGNIINIVNYVQAHKPGLTSETPSLPATPSEGHSLANSISSIHIDAIAEPPLHTRFLPDPHPIRDRSFWLLHGLAAHGTLYIDAGAHRALASKAGLYAAGVVDVEGQFAQQEAVRLVVVQNKDPKWSSAAHENSVDGGGVPVVVGPIEIGRALVNYSSAEITRIKGLKSTEIGTILGYADSEYVALRENVSLTKRDKGSRPVTPGPVGETSEGGIDPALVATRRLSWCTAVAK